MPIHDLGYRAWTGKFTNSGRRWAVIAINGIRIAARSQWIRRTLLFSLLPALSLGVFLFLYEQSVKNRWIQDAPITDTSTLSQLENSPLGVDPDLTSLVDGLFMEADEGGRHQVWAWLFNSFFKYSQGAMMLLLVGLIAPPLISKDMRTRAFLLYFSRPIGRLEYIMGKIAIPAGFVAAITLMPGMLLYIFAVLLAPSLTVVLDTWDIPLRIVAASAVAIVPASCLALMFSSLTTESRFAGFAWFAIWTLGGVAWLIIYFGRAEESYRNGTQEDPDSIFSLLSIYHTIGKVQRWVFGLDTDLMSVMPSMLMLTGLTIVSLLILWRRVSAPLRV